MMQLECHAGVLNGRAARFSLRLRYHLRIREEKKTGEICSPVLSDTRKPG
jgi:hypothetical protein